MLERGSAVEKRTERVEHFWKTGELDTDSNVQFGEGGAGTFSDGKLTTRIHDPLCQVVLNTFVRFGAPKEIVWQQKPHIGTDHLRGIVAAIRREIERLGGTVQFESTLTGFSWQGDRLQALYVDGQELPAEVCVLALGHSARDTLRMLVRHPFVLHPKPFSVGVRIEHPQSIIDEALYGRYAKDPVLGPGEYALSHREGERAVYTFCMCPGGVVVPAASQEGGVVTNGIELFCEGWAKRQQCALRFG